MKGLTLLALVLLTSAACTATQKRVSGAAVGGVGGAVVGGPIGAAAGAAVGAAATPSIYR